MIINRSVLRGRDYLVRVLFLNSYKYSIVLFFIFIFVVGVFQHFIQNEKLELFYIALLFLPLLGLEKYEAVLNAKQKFAKIRLLSLISLSCHIGLSLIFMQLTDQYLYIFLSLFIIKLFTVCVGLLYANKLLIKEEVDYDPKDDLKEGYRLSLLSFYNVGIGHLDKLIVGLIDYKLLAIYAIGLLIPMKAKDQLRLIVNIMTQSWAKSGDEVYKNQLKKFHNLTFLLTLILAIFLAYGSSFYIPILFTEEYLSSQNIIWIISFSIPFILSASAHETFIVVFHNTVFYQKVTYSKQVIYLVSLAILVPNFGIVGIAVSILIRSIYDFSINYIYYNRYKDRAVSV
jgi:O-antigen/teichoic acid export membrane protein